MSASRQQAMADVWLIYPSEEDPGKWVAHSLNTDQLAVGDSVEEAYELLLQVMEELKRAWREDPDLDILSPAPEEVRSLLSRARPMPREIVERVARRRSGAAAERPKRKPPYGGRFRALKTDAELAIS